MRLPSRPHIYYKAEWRGYDHWLGLPDEPLTLPRLATGKWGHCQDDDCAVQYEDEDEDDEDEAM